MHHMGKFVIRLHNLVMGLIVNVIRHSFPAGNLKKLVQQVFKRQHTWLGYVFRISNERIAKIAPEVKVEGRRHVGRPKMS